MSVSSDVAPGLMSFCLSEDGTLQRDLIVDYAVCGGLLVDLCLSGHLTNMGDGIEVDPTPTGFPATDRLLAEVVKHPDRTIDWWLRRGGIGQREVADSLVEVGRWVRLPRLRLHARFKERDP